MTPRKTISGNRRMMLSVFIISPIERQRSPSGASCATYAGTDCWCYYRFHILEYSFRISQIRTAPHINPRVINRGNPSCHFAKLGNITANNNPGATMITIIVLNSAFTRILCG